jgi:hypothetical protein
MESPPALYFLLYLLLSGEDNLIPEESKVFYLDLALNLSPTLLTNTTKHNFKRLIPC